MNEVLNPPAAEIFDPKPRGFGLYSWVATVDHKRIGLLYLLTAAFFFGTGTVLFTGAALPFLAAFLAPFGLVRRAGSFMVYLSSSFLRQSHSRHAMKIIKPRR